MIDLRQTSQYAKYLGNIGWIVKRKDGVNYFIKKIPIIGSVIKIQRPEKLDYRLIDLLIVKNKAFQIVIEPKNKFQLAGINKHGYKLGKSAALPSKTIQIDLSKSEKSLLSEMHYKTRYNIRKASQNQNFKIQISNDIDKYADFWQECALKQRGMFLSQVKEIREIYKAFGDNAQIIAALHHNELVSGILLIHSHKISYYMYAASSVKGKKLYAPTLNAWEAIILSKKRGSNTFDFEGIYDERFPLNSWKGFTRFKRSFGGKVVEYPGAFVKYRLPF